MADILNIDYVLCPYCMAEGKEKRLKMVTRKHLAQHQKTLEDAKKDFPDALFICKKSSDKKKEIGNNCSTANKMKLIKCCNCGEEIEVRNNTANKQLCSNCLEKWKNGDTEIENPDGRTKTSSNEAREKTMLNTYGVTNCRNIDGVSEKIKKTNEKIHGGTGFGSEVLADKSQDTMEKEYGERNWYKTVKGREQAKKQLNSEEANLKSRMTLTGMPSSLKGVSWEERLGKEKAILYKKRRSEQNLIKSREDLVGKLKKFNVTLEGEYTGVNDRLRYRCATCGEYMITTWSKIIRIDAPYKCPVCFPRNNGKSMAETEIINFIHSLDPNLKIIHSDRTQIKPKELDIYIPSKNLAIEYNGMYVHSEFYHYREEGTFDPKYHLKKTLACEEKGIRLIHITDRQWKSNKTIIENTLTQILGYNNGMKIHARKCEIREISATLKNQFLNTYHLMLRDASTIKLGAFHNDDLVAVMTFSHPNFSKQKREQENVWELNRFAIKHNIRISGIAGKLLSHFKKNYEWNEIHTMADRSWSKGDLYYKLGFDFIGYTDLDYCYVDVNGHVYSRQSQRKREDESKFLTEWELRREEGKGRYYGCGNLKFVMKNNDFK